MAPNSLRRGGVNVAYCDGRVEFLSETVDSTAWLAAGPRDSAELIDHQPPAGPTIAGF